MPKTNEKFKFVQDLGASVKRTNIVASGSLGKVMNYLYVCFFFLFVSLEKKLGYCFRLRPYIS